MNRKILGIALLIFALHFSAIAQNLTQTIRGTVIDKISNAALPGAVVMIANTDIGTSTDENGNFKLTKVPVGKQTLRITFVGYKDQFVSNIVVNSGKEVVLTISMDENFVQSKEVVVTAKTEKNKPLNEMATVSARTFSVEETQKFAAAYNDPGRTATSFAGVVSTFDGNNNISIRGNSPNALLWRMEGIDIPNPNHFASPGSAGGGISILSAQLLGNSDFMTAAFPAEYGNSIGGVFDLKLRKGNNEKQENTLQAGFLGLDAATEGPFKKGYGGSYLVNYRYSTLSLLTNMGVITIDGVTDFQDLSYNVFLPTKKAGNFSLFGFAGLSSQKYDAVKDSTEWKDDDERYSEKFHSNTGAFGLAHSYVVNQKTYLRSAVAASINGNGFTEHRFDNNYTKQLRYDESTDQNKYTISTTLHHKFNARHNLRTGVVFNTIDYSINSKGYEDDLGVMVEHINTSGSASTVQAFAQTTYYLTEKFSVNGGLHYFEFLKNNSNSIEPRGSLKYDLTPKQSIAVGYGLHSQMQPIGAYFAKYTDANGNTITPNENLELSKSHHYVLSYDRALTEYTHVKAEIYYQNLFNIPVRGDTVNSFSLINVEDGYVTDPLVNKGKGENYGLDLTLEQFMKKDFYFLLSASIYESKYKGSDNVWRNTRYNGNYAFSFTSGKEIATGPRFKNRIIGINVKVVYCGGFRDTPIDLPATQVPGNEQTRYKENEAYSLQNPAYFRPDLRVSLKRNRAKSTHTLALDIQNVANHKNFFARSYNFETQKVVEYHQLPLLPIFSYKVEF
jgi:hypothetical protein